MSLKLYNYRSRKKNIFKPLKKRAASLYTCGPTVYNFQHIGNYRTYIFEDILRRALTYSGYKVKHVMNITDVGHLTDDVDTGEEKMEIAARRENRSVGEVARFFTEEFKKDIQLLNILPAHVLAPATTYIQEQIAMIGKLVKKGYAYETKTAVFFNVPKFKNYTKYSHQDLKKMLVGARDEVVVDAGKRHPADFVLWFKLVGRFKNHTMRWPSLWGQGFPGWHIECSAISSANLGQPFDIHTGGVDHIFPHHTNEIAQSEAAYGKPLAHYWLEGEHLLVDGGKMAKSIGNVYTLTDLEKNGFSPFAFRYLVLTAHYRSRLNFTWESLRDADKSLAKLRHFIDELRKIPTKSLKKMPAVITVTKKEFKAAIEDDLNTPRAIALMWKLAHKYNSEKEKFNSKTILAALYDFDKVLGLDLKNIKKDIIPTYVLKLAKKREEFRKAKNWAEADRLRKEIEAAGFTLQDAATGPQIKKR